MCSLLEMLSNLFPALKLWPNGKKDSIPIGIIIKITETLSVLSLVDRCVYMRVYCKHDCQFLDRCVYSKQGCGLRKLTRSPKVPSHEILAAQHLLISLYEKSKFFQSPKGKSKLSVHQALLEHSPVLKKYFIKAI